MSTRVINIVVDPSGARAGFQQIILSASRLQHVLNAGRGSAVALVSALSIDAFKQYADTYTLLQNRIRLVTSSQAEQIRINQELLSLANETRSSFESTVELYSRMARSTERLGLSQQEVIDLTKTINQSIQISGSTATEAAYGVIQFGQAMGAGRLNGEELRSVLEQMPRLAQAIADGLGVTVGELKELGAEGKITSDRLADALKSQAPKIALEFERITPTIEGAFTVLNNQVFTSFGQIDQAVGTSKAFAKTVLDLSENVDDATQDIILFGLAMRESMSIRIAEAAAALETMPEKFALFKNTIKGTVATMIQGPNGPWTQELAAQRVELEKALQLEEAAAQARLDEIVKGLKERGEKNVTDYIDGLAGASEVDLSNNRPGQGLPKPENDRQTDADNFLETLRKQTIELQMQNEYGSASQQHIRAATIAELERAGISKDLIAAMRAQANELAIQEEITERITNNQNDADYISQLQKELTLLQAEGDARINLLALQQLSIDATDVQIKQAEDLIRAIEKQADVKQMDSLEEELAILKAQGDERYRLLAIQQLSEHASEVEIANAAELIKQIEKAREAQQFQLITLEEINREFVRGIGSAVGKFVRDFEGGFDSIKQAFSDLMLDLAAQIIENIVITQFAKMFQNNSGGIFGAIAGLFGAGVAAGQFGAPAVPGRPMMVGEGNRPEIFIPTEPGYVKPLSQIGGATTVVVVNEQDPRALLSIMETRDGVRLQRNFVNSDRRNIKRTLGVR